ncbi:proline dehydrogenase 1, mitochondrial isoform X2 [Folsomia candida]|uniref:Proline dehydrogenase n=1 Tax=Folsomia candida TaxID=158441 RepID=A0A226E7L8_FOLCA|nr:proline dehydrogenase 1, mitochondrial isoform X2 [Folsomia candida]OXA52967.1 Proline dehydrogenase 1, mitochondrial [Folsomia candida]
MAGFRFVFGKNLLFDPKFNSTRNLNLTLLGLNHSSPYATTTKSSPLLCTANGVTKHSFLVRNASTTTTTTPPPVLAGTGVGDKPQQEPYKMKIRDTLDLTFSDARQAYRSKSTWEILRAYIVFKLCSINYLVEHNDKLMKLGQKVLGKTIFEKMMEATFYGHFVAGPDQIAIQPRIQHLREHGVKAILDYSVEEDISDEEAKKSDSVSSQKVGGSKGSSDQSEYTKYQEGTSNRRMKAAARTYFYMNEAQCERNMETFLQSIEAVSGATKGAGFAAIKVTALGRPQLLLQLSEAIARVHRYVGTFTGKRGVVMEQNVKVEDIKRRLERASKSDPTVESWLNNMTYDKSGLIHVLPWQGVVEAQQTLKEALKVPDVSTGKMESLVPPLSDHEEEMFKNMMRRLHTIFKTAKKLDVRVMVDAEQSYFQPAISRLAMEMSRIYNTEKAIVFNTYQCYLKEAHHNLSADLDQAERQNFFFGAKLVRGAYMEQERQRAAEMGYEDPINPNFEATTEMYQRNVNEAMTRIKRMKEIGDPKKICIMMATHNEDTVRFVIKNMKEYGIKRSDRLICFGQLYGMCDQVSFPLGQSGYSVYKYVPYGPVTEVLPYLSRRAQENRGFLKKIKKETTLLRKEFARRLMKGQLFYRPKGHYEPL